MCVCDLTRVSATHPAMALLRAPIVIIEPTAVHSHSLILLHGAAHMLPAETRSLREMLLVETRRFVRCRLSVGMHCDGRMFQRLPQILTALGGNASGTRFIFPSSPVRTISWPQGPESGVRAWYDYYTARGGSMRHDEINRTHLKQMTQARRSQCKNRCGSAPFSALRAVSRPCTGCSTPRWRRSAATLLASPSEATRREARSPSTRP